MKAFISKEKGVTSLGLLKSVGCCDLLPGWGSGEAEENDGIKQATGHTKHSGL